LRNKTASPQGDKAVVFFGNPNNCNAIVGRTANGRPYNASK